MATTTARPRTIVGLLLGASSLLVASCSLDVVDTAESPSRSASEQASESASEQASGQANETEATEPAKDPDVTETIETDGDLNRSAWESLTTIELDCSSGEEVVSATGQVATITADCDRVVVTAVGAVVLTQAVGELEVSGTGSVVVLTSVEQVTITGTGISVGWESGSPTVVDTGTGSTARILKEDER